MGSHHLRVILLNLVDHLSENDRERLRFYIGPDVPRIIRDDSSFAGILRLWESLFDQDKINEEDFTYLINALDEIHCRDAVKLLREHMRRMQAHGLKESLENLASIIPPTAPHITIEEILGDQDKDDKLALKSPLMMVQNNNNTNIKPTTIILGESTKLSLNPKIKQLWNVSSLIKIYFLSFVLFSVTVLGVMICFCIERTYRIGELQNIVNATQRNLSFVQEKCNQYNEINKLLINQLKDAKEGKESSKTTFDGIWLKPGNGKIPSDAVVGGQEGNKLVYIARSKLVNNCIIPGKLVEGTEKAIITHFGVHSSSNYEVLIRSNPEQEFKWSATRNAIVPEGALVAGKEEAVLVYVGRIHYNSTMILLGKHVVPDGTFYYAHDGHEMSTKDNFEVLCIS